MRTMKRIISAVLVLSLLAVGFCSCDLFTKPEALVVIAEAALTNKTYTVESTITYDSADEKMKDAISAFTNPTILTEVEGDSFRITMTFEKDGRENGVIYTYVDGVLYTVLDEYGATTKTKDTVSEADKANLKKKLGQGVSVGFEDFNDVKVKTTDNVSVITCNEIKDEPLDALVKILSEQLPTDTVVAIKNASLTINLKDGLYDTTLLTCEYVITTPDAVYTLTMTYTSEFKYVKVDEIKAPTF